MLLSFPQKSEKGSQTGPEFPQAFPSLNRISVGKPHSPSPSLVSGKLTGHGEEVVSSPCCHTSRHLRKMKGNDLGFCPSVSSTRLPGILTPGLGGLNLTRGAPCRLCPGGTCLVQHQVSRRSCGSHRLCNSEVSLRSSGLGLGKSVMDRPLGGGGRGTAVGAGRGSSPRRDPGSGALVWLREEGGKGRGEGQERSGTGTGAVTKVVENVASVHWGRNACRMRR